MQEQGLPNEYAIHQLCGEHLETGPKLMFYCETSLLPGKLEQHTVQNFKKEMASLIKNIYYSKL